jgi:beta-lactamase regulating signal transducer with metallopeptidase domain
MSLVENLYNPFINALGWTLIHSIWQILAIAIIWRIFIFLSRNASSSFRYYLSFLAFVSIPVIFCFTFLNQIKIYGNAARVVSIEIENGFSIPTKSEAQLYLIEKSDIGFLKLFETLAPFIVGFYLVGLFVFSLITVIGYYKVRRLRKRDKTTLSAEWQEKLEAITKIIGLKKIPRVFQSARISVPALIGFFRPVILLPVAMMSSLTTNQVEAILYHELFHLKRYDHYLNMLQNIIEALFFYHPAIWWIGKRIRFEREGCVDELVVEQTQNPHIYATALIKLEECRDDTFSRSMVAATNTKFKLLTRIKNIMIMKTKTENIGQRIAAFLVIIAAAVSLAWVLPAKGTNDNFDDSMKSRSELLLTDIIENVDDGSFNIFSTDANNGLESSDIPKGKLVLEDGKTVEWEKLSEEDKKRIVAEINQAMEELREYFAGEFKEEMKQAGKEVQEAMRTAKEELEKVDFKMVGEEIRLAQKEIAKAMEEVKEQLQDGDKIFKGMDKAFKSVDWNQFGDEMQKTMQELSVELQKIGPTIQESLKDLNIGEILKEVFDSLEKINQKPSQN